MMESMKFLNDGIVDRIVELHGAAEYIATIGKKLTFFANSVKVITVCLGAIAASKGTFDIVFGADNKSTLLFFTVLGLVITICTGVEAAFKFEKRGTELTILGSSCHSTARNIGSEWRAHIGSNLDTDQREAAKRLIRDADEKLNKLQTDAARLGTNLTLQKYLSNELASRDALAAHRYERFE
jgi:hypothetical protein